MVYRTARFWLPVSLFSVLLSMNCFANDEHTLFTQILREHVHTGRVSYATLQNDVRLEEYCRFLSGILPDTLTAPQREIAFWTNVYNAFTLKLIVENYPLESINDLHLFGSLILGTVFSRTVWDTYTFDIGGEKYTLNRVEHEILREKYDDARVHGALVCASKSCPPLRAEAYEAGRLDEQLDDQMRAFCGNPAFNRFDKADGTLYLSKIFDWFESDFGADQSAAVKNILQYFPPEVHRNADAIQCVKYLDYDWSLNE